jgi:RNA polymerase sigma-70 factor, ECF subfamily
LTVGNWQLTIVALPTSYCLLPIYDQPYNNFKLTVAIFISSYTVPCDRMTRKDFDHLIQLESRRLYGFAFRILRSQEEAEDVVQEVFIKLWNMGDRLAQYKSIDALATTMTKNYSIDLLRKQKHRISGIDDSAEYHNRTSPSPYEEMENRESAEILHMIIDDLPGSYKDVIRLRDIEGATFEEIAEKTDQNINTLRVTLSRARKFIREKYNKYQYERRGIEKTDRKVL